MTSMHEKIDKRCKYYQKQDRHKRDRVPCLLLVSGYSVHIRPDKIEVQQ